MVVSRKKPAISEQDAFPMSFPDCVKGGKKKKDSRANYAPFEFVPPWPTKAVARFSFFR